MTSTTATTSSEPTSEKSETDLIRKTSIESHMFGKGKEKVGHHREQTLDPYFGLKVKIYCALHKPIGWAKVYHFLVLIVFFFSIIALNIFNEELANEGQIFDTTFSYLKVIIDSTLILILCFELVLRNWTCDVISEYKHFRGRLLYCKTHALSRGLDVFAIMMFFFYIINHIYIRDTTLDSDIRITHLTQVFQLYRLLYRFLNVLIETIIYQKNQMIIVLIFVFFALILSAFCIYLTERDYNKDVDSIFDAFWLTYVTFSTIGYGDVYPVTELGKCVVIICGSFGIIILSLPGSILGTGLALKIEEEERKLVTHRIPAIKLIQSIWRSYATHKLSDSEINWRHYRRTDGQPFTSQDRSCVRFLRIVVYLKQRHRFKVVMGLINDDFFRERITRELSRRLRLTENDIKLITNNVNNTIEKRKKTNKLLIRLKKKIKKMKNKLKDSEDKHKDKSKDNSSTESGEENT